MSKNSQRGDAAIVTVIVVGVLLIAGLIALYVWGQSEQEAHNKMFTNWSQDCRRAGGVVQQTSPNRSDCYIDQKVYCFNQYKFYKHADNSNCQEWF